MTRGDLTTMYRADHYEAADRLVAKARRLMAETDLIAAGELVDPGERRPRVELLLMAAQVHATLAAVPREVEAEVKANERAVSAAVVSAEETRVRLLGGSVDPVVESPAYGVEPTDEQRARCSCLRPGVNPGREHPRGAPGCEFR